MTFDVSRQVDANTIERTAADGDDLPVIATRDALAALDQVLIANAAEARAQASGYQGDTYSSIVRDRFLAEYSGAEALPTRSSEAGTLMSKRKRLVQGMVLEAGKKNSDLCVLGMSGTPVINTLQEGKSLVEMLTGHRHDDLEVVATVQNCLRLYQRLVTLGRGTVLEFERVLTDVRLRARGAKTRGRPAQLPI